MPSSSDTFRLTVAVPFYNEEAVLPELLERLGRTLDRIDGGPHEIVCVDDGSQDRTWSILEAAASDDSRLVLLRLSRNFGHQAAFSAALDHATGDAVVMMDGDLQDPPEAIPRFVEQHHQGFDVVYARRIRRKEPWPLRLNYFLFYRIAGVLSDVPLPVDAGDFALLSRRVVDVVTGTRERHRFLRGLRSWAGFRQTGLEVERGDRAAGRTKYTLRKLLRLAADGIFSFTVAPLRLASVVGALTMLFIGAYGAYALYAKLFLDRSPAGFTALILTIIFVSAVNLFFMGIIGEYVGRIYQEGKARPLYVVERLTRGASTEDAAREGSGAPAKDRGEGAGHPNGPTRSKIED